MQKAAFSIINYQFDRVQIDLNNHKSKDLALAFETKGLYDNENSTFELQFVVNVSNKVAENPFVKSVVKEILNSKTCQVSKKFQIFFTETALLYYFLMLELILV